ncbi:MAG: hypothetical protein IPI65_00110 [Bacteroidetes bacterium]|nr:hypothetical protein [Bacteroidota bacterium]
MNNDFLLGIFAALLSTYLTSRFKLAYDLNRARIALLGYMDTLILSSINTYNNQCNKVIEYVLNFGTEKGKSIKYNHLPTLNADYFKSFDITTLRKVIQADSILGKFINMQSSINYLQNPSPFELVMEFRSKMNEHKEKYHENDSIDLFNKCQVVISLKDDLETALQFKVEATVEMKRELEEVTKYLNGNSLSWIFIYGFYKKSI